MAAQLIATNGASARGLSACSDRANSSLPVPLSPSIKTVVSVAAARWSDAVDLTQRRILAHEQRRPAPDRQLLFQQQVFGDDAALVERAGNEEEQMIGVDGLREEVHRPFLHRGHRILDAAVGGHDDDRNVGIDLLRGAQHPEAVAVRQAQIRQHHCRLPLLQLFHGFGLVLRLEDGMPLTLQRQPEHRP